MKSSQIESNTYENVHFTRIQQKKIIAYIFSSHKNELYDHV